MIQAEQRIEPRRMAGGHGFEVKQRIGEREAGIDGIRRRASATTTEGQCRREQLDIRHEIGGRRGPFDAEHGRNFDPLSIPRQPALGRLKPGDRTGEYAAFVRPTIQRLVQKAQLCLRLGGNQCPRPLRPGVHIAVSVELAETAQDVVVRPADAGGEMPAMSATQHHDARASLRDCSEYGGR